MELIRYNLVVFTIHYISGTDLYWEKSCPLFEAHP
jgi:hypothetical protein